MDGTASVPTRSIDRQSLVEVSPMSSAPRKLKRHFDHRNLVRELSSNRAIALEILREALANAKDHAANRVWVRTIRANPNVVSMFIVDDGDGMDDTRLAAFWGIGRSEKSFPSSIGYKGHGTKLYFDCEALSVATRTSEREPWLLMSLEHPLAVECDTVDVTELPTSHPLYEEIRATGIQVGTAIHIVALKADDRARLLSRNEIESYCDWFTVIGDVRSGLFDKRKDFHDAVAAKKTAELRLNDASLVPLELNLRVNGDAHYYPVGQLPKSDHFQAWTDDLRAYKSKPGLVAFGHRFADSHIPSGATTRVRDDLSALRLTSPSNWATEDGISIVARVEGHRRQRETYLEAAWQNHKGIYSFEDRFGLWLCKDFVPVVQRNHLLRRALDQASKQKMKFELGKLRNWQVFVNDQFLQLTANRNDVANQAAREELIVKHLTSILDNALRETSFREWVARLKNAAIERERNQELQQIDGRLEAVEKWLKAKTKKDQLDISGVEGLEEIPSNEALLVRRPETEQELFYVYGLLSGRFNMPVHVVEYDAQEGIDAIAVVRSPKLVGKSLARVEFKLRVEAGSPLHHYFDAIDLVTCWEVGKVGDIYEETSAGIGKLRKRTKPVLEPALDTHEIVYTDHSGKTRTIPVLSVGALFGTK